MTNLNLLPTFSDNPHLDNIIGRLNDRHGLHLDAKQVLRKIGGRRPGKRCKGGWISAEKKCSDHKTADGKLTAAGKSSAAELAGKVRDRKGMRDRIAPNIEVIPKKARSANVKPKKMTAAENTRKEIESLTKTDVGRSIITAIADHSGQNGLGGSFVGTATGYPALHFVEGAKGIDIDREVSKAVQTLRTKIYPDLEDSQILKKLKKTVTTEDRRRLVKNKLIHRLGYNEEQAESVMSRSEFRSDSLHLDSHEITRYTRAIESLNSRYGWHLDAQKTLSRLGKKLGKKCGGGWISPEKKCKSHYSNGKLNEAGKTSSADLADRIRSRKKMTAIRSRDGKMKNGQWDIGAAFAPGNEQQSSIRASRTGPNNNRTLNPDRAARMKAKEENRARVNWGKTTGDWKQTPDSTAAMDMVKPKPIDAPKTDPKKPAMSDGTVIEKGQDVWLSGTWDGGSKQKRTVVSWSKDKKTVTLRPTTLNPDQARRVREERKNSIYDRKYPASVLHVSEESANKDIERAAIEEASYKKRVYDMRVREITAPTPIASAKPLKDLFSEADRIGAKYSGPSTMAERRIAKQEADRIMEESGVTQAVGRAIGKVAMIDPARTPVRIPNQRRSNEPRKRGRSVD